MEDHHTVLFPTFLILFAAFLSYNLVDLSDAPQAMPAITGFDVYDARPQIPNLVTGLDIVSDTCDGDDVIFYAYDLENSHAAMVNGPTSTNFCSILSPGLAVANPTRVCDGENVVIYVSNGYTGEFIDNAHAYAPDIIIDENTSDTIIPVCYDGVICVSDTSQDQCATLSANTGRPYECVASLSSQENAHVQACDGTYPVEVCCTSSCGNCIIGAGEACDDGNTVDGDGCSSDCQFETNVPCSGGPNACLCPNGYTACSDGTCKQDCGNFKGNSNNNGICEYQDDGVKEGCHVNDCISGNAEGVVCDTGLLCDAQLNVCVGLVCGGCPSGTTLCDDGTCQSDCSVDPPCNDDLVCDAGESCACADCDGEQDSCQTGLVCDFASEQCVQAPPCGPGTTLCADGYCHENCAGIGDPPCNDDLVCDAGESCACADCDGEQDSCQTGLVCNNNICSPEPDVDSDGDGLLDSQDNCPYHPNSVTLGSCIPSATQSYDPADAPIICTADSDCGPEEYCELSQGNLDNDPCGNACDLDSSDFCTCGSLEDNCDGPGACEIALAGGSFTWSTDGPVNEGTELTLTLNPASDACDGVGFSVTVYDDEHNMFSTATPEPITVEGVVGTTTWIAEHNLDDIDALQSWRAQALQGGNQNISISTSNNVAVNSGGSFCGDGTEDAGEQCDDGNNDNFDGCDEDCVLEGSNGDPPPDCETFCVPFSCICSDVDAYACCGDYNGDGCYEFSDPITCQAGTSCSNDFGMCVEPGCETKNQETKEPSCANIVAGWACGAWSDCSADNKATRTCMKCGNTCPNEPITEIYCTLEPAVKGPAFSGSSMVLALALLTMFYFIRHGRIRKK